MNNYRKYGRWIIYSILGIAVLFIAYQTPYCHDEWHWGLPSRVELMKKGFENYNGRYLGNLLALLITRSEICKMIVMAGGIWLVVYLMDLCVCNYKDNDDMGKNIVCLMIGIFLLFSMPQTLYAQSHGWPAAFVNFVPAVILFLIYFKLTEEIYSCKELVYSRWQTIVMIPLGIATQLFSEHITVFVVLYAFWMLVYSKVKRKRFYGIHVSYFVATVIGVCVMFSNEAYQNAASKPTSYKHITLSIAEVYEQFTSGILDNLFLNNWVLNISLSIVLMILICLKKKKSLLFTGLILVYSGYSVYSIWHRLWPDWVFFADTRYNVLVEIAISFVFFISILLGIWTLCEKEKRLSICVLYLSMAIVAAPLVAAKPIGPRCFYICYVLECIVILRIIRGILDNLQCDLYYVMVISGFSALILLVVYMRVFAMIGASDRYRDTLIESAVETNAEEVVLPYLPYSQFTWITVPPNEKWEGYFKEFYGIPEEMDVIFQ